MNDKLNVDITVTINGMSIKEFEEKLREYQEALKKAKSLAEELASMKIKITF